MLNDDLRILLIILHKEEQYLTYLLVYNFELLMSDEVGLTASIPLAAHLHVDDLAVDDEQFEDVDLLRHVLEHRTMVLISEHQVLGPIDYDQHLPHLLPDQVQPLLEVSQRVFHSLRPLLIDPPPFLEKLVVVLQEVESFDQMSQNVALVLRQLNQLKLVNAVPAHRRNVGVVHIALEGEDVFVFLVVVDCSQADVVLVEDRVLVALPFLHLEDTVAFGKKWHLAHFLSLRDQWLVGHHITNAADVPLFVGLAALELPDLEQTVLIHFLDVDLFGLSLWTELVKVQIRLIVDLLFAGKVVDVQLAVLLPDDH